MAEKKSELGEILTLVKTGQIGKLFRGTTQNGLIQFFRYCFVGGIATVVDWGLSALLFYTVFHQTSTGSVWANCLSFVAGLIVNYIMSTFWVFDPETAVTQNKVIEFLGFAAIGLVGLGITFGITKLFAFLLADVTSSYQILAKIVSTVISFLWNFFARKYLLYNKK